jgi:hypothetical protein
MVRSNTLSTVEFHFQLKCQTFKDLKSRSNYLLTCLDMKRTKFSPFILHEIDMNTLTDSLICFSNLWMSDILTGNEIPSMFIELMWSLYLTIRAAWMFVGYKAAKIKMHTSFIEFQRPGCNWTVDRVLDLTIHITRYSPRRGSNYMPLPSRLRSKHVIINVVIIEEINIG